MSFNINFNCGPPPVGQYKIGEKESILECINSLPKCDLPLQQKPEVGCQQTAEIADDSFDCSNLTAAQLEQLALLTAAANPGQSSVSLMVMIPAESLLEIVQVLSGTAAQIVSMSSTVLKGNSSKGTTSEVPIWVDAGVGVPPSVGDMEMYQSPEDKPSVVVQTQSKSTTDNQSFRILEHVIIPSQQPGSLCKQEQQLMATTAGGSAQTSVQSPTMLSLLTANNVNHHPAAMYRFKMSC
ncbi:helicase domino isoform X2 [Drosophila persimilis]|uniref:helicase domino isoform X2 n=1 Tax=Drosophila persimilis TaxID=7234 RepID=UPI000F07BCE1|nr:helicase domino isoform X2 [Drosophila persimilis]